MHYLQQHLLTKLPITYVCFNGHLPGKPGLAGTCRFLPLLVLEQNLWG